jgi:hypothetical protein
MEKMIQNRLEGHARIHHWNMSHKQIGTHLQFVCPFYDRAKPPHGCYKRAGMYVVQGIRNFLNAAGQRLLMAAQSARTPSIFFSVQF